VGDAVISEFHGLRELVEGGPGNAEGKETVGLHPKEGRGNLKRLILLRYNA